MAGFFLMGESQNFSAGLPAWDSGAGASQNEGRVTPEHYFRRALPVDPPTRAVLLYPGLEGGKQCNILDFVDQCRGRIDRLQPGRLVSFGLADVLHTHPAFSGHPGQRRDGGI